MREGLYVIWDNDGWKYRGQVTKTFNSSPSGLGKIMYEVTFDNDGDPFTRNFDDRSFEENLRIDPNQKAK